MFAVVEFRDGVAIISAKWFDGVEEERAFWPPGDGRAVARLAKLHAEPANTWTSYPVRVMGKAGNYDPIVIQILIIIFSILSIFIVLRPGVRSR